MAEAPTAYDLEIKLQGCFDIFEQDRDEYWNKRLEEDDWSPENQFRRDADSLAAAILKRVEELQNTAETSGDLNELYRLAQIEEIELRQKLSTLEADLAGRLDRDTLQKVLEYFRAELRSVYEPVTTGETPRDLIWQRVWVDQARGQLSQIQDRVDRIWRLDELVSKLRGKSKLPRATRQFLKLVSRSYVSGFDAECTIVCRGVIDTLFRERVPISLVEARRVLNPDRDPGLLARIEAAKPTLISDEIFRAANDVRLRGDDAVHHNPHAVINALDTIEKTLRIVDHFDSD